jgi:hypothetical protein
MKAKFFAAAIAASLFFGYIFPSQALTFHFSFTNTANGGGVVEGIISGLTDNATSAATSVQVTANSAGFGVGEYIGSPTENLFAVTAQVITNVGFLSFGAYNTSPAVTCCSLFLQPVLRLKSV